MNHYRRRIVLVVIGALLLLSPIARAADFPAGPSVELIEVKKIWDQAPHNAFTDLMQFKGTWYCVFREGSAHIPGLDGTIRVLRSKDGGAWESAALLAEKGIDLRDPKISVRPDGQLMIVMGGSVYAGAEPTPGRKFASGHSRVSFSADGEKWSAPQPVQGIGDGHWLWRVTWHAGAGYGTVYSTAKQVGKARALTIWKTADGIAYEKIAEPVPGIDLSEATIRFRGDDTMVVLLRGEEKDRHAWIGASAKPYQKWDWHDGGHAAHGPNFAVLPDGRMFYGGRDFPEAEKGASKTVFGRMTLDKLEPLVTLPSGGDTSYPGIVDAGDGTIWVSYYASHENKRASIYLAKVRVGAAAR